MYRYGFNAAESRRAFLRAAHAGGDCATCLWGVAYSLVPDVNDWRTSAARRAAGRAAAVAASRVLARKIVKPEQRRMRRSSRWPRRAVFRDERLRPPVRI